MLTDVMSHLPEQSCDSSVTRMAIPSIRWPKGCRTLAGILRVDMLLRQAASNAPENLAYQPGRLSITLWGQKPTFTLASLP
jgi:hypothetical protein